ncbi:MAG: hypothetical protein EBU77_04855 [Betaproteobacteria bacterium]|nr:hypothetical protein [Betaproteobacteria bacterium]
MAGFAATLVGTLGATLEATAGFLAEGGGDFFTEAGFLAVAALPLAVTVTGFDTGFAEVALLPAAAFTGGLADALDATTGLAAGLAATLVAATVFAKGLAAGLAADLAAVGLDLRSGILFLDSKQQNQRPGAGRHEVQQGRQARRANIWCAVLAGMGGSCIGVTVGHSGGAAVALA